MSTQKDLAGISLRLRWICEFEESSFSSPPTSPSPQTLPPKLLQKVINHLSSTIDSFVSKAQRKKGITRSGVRSQSLTRRKTRVKNRSSGGRSRNERSFIQLFTEQNQRSLYIGRVTEAIANTHKEKNAEMSVVSGIKKHQRYLPNIHRVKRAGQWNRTITKTLPNSKEGREPVSRK